MSKVLLLLVVALFQFVSYHAYSAYPTIKTLSPLQYCVKINSTYYISQPIDLSGGVLYVPANSRLKFIWRGEIFNGTLVGDNTSIMGRVRFSRIRIKGSFDTQNFYSSWLVDDNYSDFISDIMNISHETRFLVENDIVLSDSIREVDHLFLEGKGETIMNSDRFIIVYGGCSVKNLVFRWDKPPVTEPNNNSGTVILFSSLIQKDTTVNVSIENVKADGARYSSFFLKQYMGKVEPKLRTINSIVNCEFSNFTRGVIWTCGGSGEIRNSSFIDIGYDNTKTLYSVYPIRLGYGNTQNGGKAVSYVIKNCTISNIVAAYNDRNDGRELHGLLAYGDSLIIQNNKFNNLSSSFHEEADTGMDSEMLYIKGSYNIIDNNEFKKGVGSLSDGVITLKVKGAKKNVIRNNRFYSGQIHHIYIRLGGGDHIIEGNRFCTTREAIDTSLWYAIYLKHHLGEEGAENVIIRNNEIESTTRQKCCAIYANQRGALSIINNTFVNVKELLRNKDRQGETSILDNKFVINGVKGSEKDIYIVSTAKREEPLIISNNVIIINDAKMGSLVLASYYCFKNNNIRIGNSSFRFLLRSEGESHEIFNNTLLINGQTNIGNTFVKGGLDTTSNNILYVKDSNACVF